MKKVLISLSFLAAVIACNSGDSSQSTENTSGGNEAAGTEQTPADQSGGAATSLSDNPDYQKGLALEAKSDCATCHKLDEKLVGPSFREIANRYTLNDDTVDSLAGKVIKGGSGNWGQVPMTPHPNMSQDDAEAIVKYILLLKQ